MRPRAIAATRAQKNCRQEAWKLLVRAVRLYIASYKNKVKWF